MAHVAIEYMIMIPILIAQIFLFPIAANAFMGVWVNARKTLELQNAAVLLGSVVQQLYLSLNSATTPSGTASYGSNLPPLIENQHYTANATLQFMAGGGPNSSNILQIHLFLAGSPVSASTSAVLGNNAVWSQSTFISSSNNAGVGAQRFPNGTISLWFTS